MPIAYAILDAPNVLLVSYQGVVTNDEFLDRYKAAYADPLYRPGMNEISDLRPMDVLDINLDAIKELAAWIADREATAETSIRVGILHRSELHEGLSRLYAAVSDVYKKETVRLFRDLPEVLDWLPLDAAHTGAIVSTFDKLARGKYGSETKAGCMI